MPRATVDRSKTRREELKSLPGAFVELRKMSYGELLEISETTARMTTPMGRRGGRVSEEDRKLSLEMKVLVGQAIAFKYAIVDHNLEDENGRKLNLADVSDVQLLDSAVGNELEELIDRMNQDEDQSPLPTTHGEPSNTKSRSLAG